MNHDEYAHKIDQLLSDTVTSDPQLHVLYCAAGLMSEAGEVTDHVLKSIKYGLPIDVSKVHEELGDVMFYFSRLMDIFDTLPHVLREQNVKKLEDRHAMDLN